MVGSGCTRRVPPTCSPAAAGSSRKGCALGERRYISADTAPWFVVGGRTALDLHGFAHYLSSAPQREVHLYGTDNRPGWVLKLNLKNRFVFHNTKRLRRQDGYARLRKRASLRPGTKDADGDRD